MAMMQNQPFQNDSRPTEPKKAKVQMMQTLTSKVIYSTLCILSNKKEMSKTVAKS